MNRIDRLRALTPYETDFAQWSAEQSALLREGRLEQLDRENVAEEIESLGVSQQRELFSRYRVLLMHAFSSDRRHQTKHNHAKQSVNYFKGSQSF